jgi:hypothetical protein
LKKKRQKTIFFDDFTGVPFSFSPYPDLRAVCSWTNNFDLTLASSRALNDVLHGNPYRSTMRATEFLGVEPMAK